MCHHDQQMMVFAGGLIEYLCNKIKWASGPQLNLRAMLASLRPCPKCGTLKSYFVTTRNAYNCARCGHCFTGTSGTPLSARKMSIEKIAKLHDEIRKGGSNLEIARRAKVEVNTVKMHRTKLKLGLI